MIFWDFWDVESPPLFSTPWGRPTPPGTFNEKFRKYRKGKMRRWCHQSLKNRRKKTNTQDLELKTRSVLKKSSACLKIQAGLWGDCQRCCWEARSGASPTFRKWVLVCDWNIVLSVNDYIAHRTDGTGMSNLYVYHKDRPCRGIYKSHGSFG